MEGWAKKASVKNQHQIGSERLMRTDVLMAATMKITVLCYIMQFNIRFPPQCLYLSTKQRGIIPGNAIFKLSEDYISGILTNMQFKISCFPFS
jgi:hypothetical protein